MNAKRVGAFEMRTDDQVAVGKRARDKQIRTEFSRNFPIYLDKANLTAAELVRLNNERAAQDPEWQEIQTYEVSRYKRGDGNGGQTPKYAHLKQIAELLGVSQNDLAPSFEGPTVSGGTRMGMRDVGGGKSLIDFCAVINSESARKIMVILASDPTEPA